MQEIKVGDEVRIRIWSYKPTPPADKNRTFIVRAVTKLRDKLFYEDWSSGQRIGFSIDEIEPVTIGTIEPVDNIQPISEFMNKLDTEDKL
jgi:hypothetical protein